MDQRPPKRSPERNRVDAAMERWRQARPGSVRLWTELTDDDKERMAMRRLRSIAGSLGWDEVLHRLGIRHRMRE